MEGNTSNPARSRAISSFISMGFVEEVVVKSVDLHVKERYDEAEILNTILAFQYDESKSQERIERKIRNAPEGQGTVRMLSEEEWEEIQEVRPRTPFESKLARPNARLRTDEPVRMNSSEPLSDEDTKLMQLVEMEFPIDQVQAAIDSCASGTSLSSLIDYISACKEREHLKRKLEYEVEETSKISRGLNEFKRNLPFFYVEDLAISTKGKCLQDIVPELVDSELFSSARKKRSFYHNLPTSNRTRLLPLPPLTISEIHPLTTQWCPSWDSRDKFDYLLASTGNDYSEDITKRLQIWGENLPEEHKGSIFFQLKKWNLVWKGENEVGLLEPEQIEVIFGYPKFHTRVGRLDPTKRRKAMRNSYQVDVIGYHLSVLKDLFPDGISVLSIYPGIGGGEIALHRLGIRLKVVVCVENDKDKRSIYRKWWDSTRQKGVLIDNITNVEMLTADKLRELIKDHGMFDLIIGGSPCKNQPAVIPKKGEVEPKMPVDYYDFCRVLESVRCLQATKRS